jgi:hypothetical protein
VSFRAIAEFLEITRIMPQHDKWAMISSVSLGFLFRSRFFRLDLVCPGEDERNGEADEHQGHNGDSDALPRLAEGWLGKADDANSYHDVDHRDPVDLPPLQLSQEQREPGCHVDGSGESRLPVPAQSATDQQNVVWVRWGQGRQVNGES